MKTSLPHKDLRTETGDAVVGTIEAATRILTWCAEVPTRCKTAHTQTFAHTDRGNHQGTIKTDSAKWYEDNRVSGFALSRANGWGWSGGFSLPTPLRVSENELIVRTNCCWDEGRTGMAGNVNKCCFKNAAEMEGIISGWESQRVVEN